MALKFLFATGLSFSLLATPFLGTRADLQVNPSLGEGWLNQVPDLLVDHYEVGGASAKEIREELDKLGPLDLSGRRRDAFTLWHIDWRWPLKTNGKADFAKTISKCEIKVTLPRLKRNAVLDQGVAQQWESFYQAILKHELKHVEIVLGNYMQVVRVIRTAYRENPALSVTEANALGHQVLEKIREQDRRLDKLTQNGRLEGVKFP